VPERELPHLVNVGQAVLGDHNVMPDMQENDCWEDLTN